MKLARTLSGSVDANEDDRITWVEFNTGVQTLLKDAAVSANE